MEPTSKITDMLIYLKEISDMSDEKLKKTWPAKDLSRLIQENFPAIQAEAKYGNWSLQRQLENLESRIARIYPSDPGAQELCSRITKIVDNLSRGSGSTSNVNRLIATISPLLDRPYGETESGVYEDKIAEIPVEELENRILPDLESLVEHLKSNPLSTEEAQNAHILDVQVLIRRLADRIKKTYISGKWSAERAKREYNPGENFAMKLVVLSDRLSPAHRERMVREPRQPVEVPQPSVAAPPPPQPAAPAPQLQQAASPTPSLLTRVMGWFWTKPE